MFDQSSVKSSLQLLARPRQLRLLRLGLRQLCFLYIAIIINVHERKGEIKVQCIRQTCKIVLHFEPSAFVVPHYAFMHAPVLMTLPIREPISIRRISLRIHAIPGHRAQVIVIKIRIHRRDLQ